MPVSGGVGVFDASLISQVTGSMTISNLAENALQNSATSFVVDPVGNNCQSSGSCSSYIIPGGPLTVSPFPYVKLNDSTLTAYITKGGPAYQIDVWDAPQVPQWPQGSCHIYSPDNSNAFQLCISSFSGIENLLTAGKVSSIFLRLSNSLRLASMHDQYSPLG